MGARSLDPFEQEALRIRIKEMLGGRHFSICDVDKIGEMIGVNPTRHRNYTFLHALHCVDFKDMSAEMKAALPLKIIECLRPEMRGHDVFLAITAEGSDHGRREDTYLDGGGPSLPFWRN